LFSRKHAGHKIQADLAVCTERRFVTAGRGEASQKNEKIVARCARPADAIRRSVTADLAVCATVFPITPSPPSMKNQIQTLIFHGCLLQLSHDSEMGAAKRLNMNNRG
jgi:hypothetical protein